MGLVVKRGEWLEFERPFAAWAYTVSFAQLLLRSAKDGRETRVDIGFSGVQGLLLKPRCPSLVLRPADEAEVAMVRSVLGLNDAADRDFWAVGELEHPGFVVASDVQWCEDDGDFTDPSEVFLPAGPFSGLVRDEAWGSTSERD
jgi:hypothetical protein